MTNELLAKQYRVEIQTVEDWKNQLSQIPIDFILHFANNHEDVLLLQQWTKKDCLTEFKHNIQYEFEDKLIKKGADISNYEKMADEIEFDEDELTDTEWNEINDELYDFYHNYLDVNLLPMNKNYEYNDNLKPIYHKLYKSFKRKYNIEVLTS